MFENYAVYASTLLALVLVSSACIYALMKKREREVLEFAKVDPDKVRVWLY